MLSFTRINQILNLASREWPRVLVAWSMIFLSRIGFIVGGSLLISIFLSRIGVELLPLLFLGSAALVMCGSIVFRNLLHKMKGELLITFTVLAAAAFLVVSIFFLQSSTPWFLVFFLIAQSVLLSQLNILISLFNEELFTPLESQRTFPVVESAETLGGIVGGLSLTLFADILPAYKFILLWVVLLMFILPIVLKFNARTMDIPKLLAQKPVIKHEKSGYKELKKYPFVKGLMIVVLLFWGIMNILEFQYTKAIQEDVLTSFATTEEAINLDQAETELYQHEISKKLGTLHVIFNGAALVMQLILASRIIMTLGINASMLIHPLVTLFNLVAMTFRFNFFTATLARGSYELTGILFKSSYDSSYYAIPHGIRRDTKEFIQGLMKPLGAILGTVGIMLIAWKLNSETETLALNALLLGMSGAMALTLSRMNTSYTQMCEQNLSHKLDLSTRLDAVEILGQNGHSNNNASMQTILRRENEPDVLKERIINSLSLQEDPEAIGALLELLKSPKEEIRYAVVKALARYQKLRTHILDQSFTRHRVIDTLKITIQKEKNEKILENLAHVFYTICPDGLTEFLLSELKKGDKIQATFVRMLKLFSDPNLRYYLEPFLTSKNPELKAAAIVALWQFKSMRGDLRHHLQCMLKNPKDTVLEQGIETVGHIKASEFRPQLKHFLNNSTHKIHKTALFSLAELDDESTIPKLLEYLIDGTHEWRNFSKRFQKILDQALALHVHEKISVLLRDNKHLCLEEMSRETLETLKKLYQKLKAHHEVHTIEKVLDSKKAGSL